MPYQLFSKKGRQWALAAALHRHRTNSTAVTALAALSVAAVTATLSFNQQQKQADDEELLFRKNDNQMPALLFSTSLQRTYCDGWLKFLTRGGRSAENTFDNQHNTPARKKTMANLHDVVEKGDLEERFEVDWDRPIGEGTFGLVYKARDRKTGDFVALKEIAQTAANDETFQREVDALLYLRQFGGHSNICQLRANYEKNGSSYLVLDYIEGGEMCMYTIR